MENERDTHFFLAILTGAAMWLAFFAAVCGGTGEAREPIVNAADAGALYHSGPLVEWTMYPERFTVNLSDGGTICSDITYNRRGGVESVSQWAVCR